MTILSNFAFIDSQNLNMGLQSLGWKLDHFKFRRYLKEKYNVARAYLFLGYMPGNKELYSLLQQAGFILIFKPILKLPDNRVKGNVDAELVLQAMND